MAKEESGDEMIDKVIKCAECGLESTIDIELGTARSLSVPESEMKRKCKLATSPNFSFSCPHFDKAIRSAISPSHPSR